MSLNPRYARIAALGTPTEREKTQWYFQRYVAHLPAAGEMVIFDRSWYNRAGVERVMGFCTEEQAQGFLHIIPLFEKVMVDSGIILLKYWLEVSPEEQTRRLKARIDDGRILNEIDSEYFIRSEGGRGYNYFGINYCPFCGRPLSHGLWVAEKKK